jgi:hypothetical protein
VPLLLSVCWRRVVSAVQPKKKSLAQITPGARSSDAPDGKMFSLDRAAARRWLVQMIAARAVQLYRQRNRSNDHGGNQQSKSE